MEHFKSSLKKFLLCRSRQVSNHLQQSMTVDVIEDIQHRRSLYPENEKAVSELRMKEQVDAGVAKITTGLQSARDALFQHEA